MFMVLKFMCSVFLLWGFDVIVVKVVKFFILRICFLRGEEFRNLDVL